MIHATPTKSTEVSPASWKLAGQVKWKFFAAIGGALGITFLCPLPALLLAAAGMACFLFSPETTNSRGETMKKEQKERIVLLLNETKEKLPISGIAEHVGAEPRDVKEFIKRMIEKGEANEEFIGQRTDMYD